MTRRRDLALALLLFVVTCVSTLYVGALGEGAVESAAALLRGLPFALPLMAILLSHELGHYVAARLHRVEVSPPYFIPLPAIPLPGGSSIPSLLGTLGAVIRMRGAIRHRDALLDIGAAGPLAGFAVAVPVFVWGVAHSSYVRIDALAGGITLGDSVLTAAVIYLAHGPTPPGHDLLLHPSALAGWAGLLVTMINLVPVGQLDGGHIAYALFGSKQQAYSRRVRAALLPLALLISAVAMARQHGSLSAAAAGTNWLMWWLVLTAMTRLARQEHPDTEPGELSPRRRWVARLTLALFPLLFMPTWIAE